MLSYTDVEQFLFIHKNNIKCIYIASERVVKILHVLGIKLRHKPARTLRPELCTVKDKRQVMDRNGVIYSIK